MLMVRIGSDELNALGAVGNHVLDGISAAAAHADDLYLYYIFKVVINFKRHSYVPLLNNLCKTNRKKPLQMAPPP